MLFEVNSAYNMDYSKTDINDATVPCEEEQEEENIIQENMIEADTVTNDF